MSMRFIEDRFLSLGWEGRLFGVHKWLRDCTVYHDRETPVKVVMLQRPDQPCRALPALAREKTRCTTILVQLGDGEKEGGVTPDIHISLGAATPIATARNIGAALVGTGLLIFIDAGVIPGSGFINSYVSQFEKYSTLLAARGRIACPGMDTPAAITGCFTLPDDIEFWPVDLDENMAVRSETFFACGGFDEALESGYSALALSIRLFGQTPDFTSQRHIPGALVRWGDESLRELPFGEYFFQRQRSWMELNQTMKGYLELYAHFWQQNASRGKLYYD